VAAGKLRLFERPGKEISIHLDANNNAVIPVGHRRFLVFEAPLSKVISILSKAELFKK
jgi:hypothetical protein